MFSYGRSIFRHCSTMGAKWSKPALFTLDLVQSMKINFQSLLNILQDLQKMMVKVLRLWPFKCRSIQEVYSVLWW